MVRSGASCGTAPRRANSAETVAVLMRPSGARPALSARSRSPVGRNTEPPPESGPTPAPNSPHCNDPRATGPSSRPPSRSGSPLLTPVGSSEQPRLAEPQRIPGRQTRPALRSRHPDGDRASGASSDLQRADGPPRASPTARRRADRPALTRSRDRNRRSNRGACRTAPPSRDCRRRPSRSGQDFRRSTPGSTLRPSRY